MSTINSGPIIDIYAVLREREECVKLFAEACGRHDTGEAIRQSLRYRDLNEKLPAHLRGEG
jgi:hypothetical protein